MTSNTTSRTSSIRSSRSVIFNFEHLSRKIHVPIPVSTRVKWKSPHCSSYSPTSHSKDNRPSTIASCSSTARICCDRWTLTAHRRRAKTATKPSTESSRTPPRVRSKRRSTRAISKMPKCSSCRCCSSRETGRFRSTGRRRSIRRSWTRTTSRWDRFRWCTARPSSRSPRSASLRRKSSSCRTGAIVTWAWWVRVIVSFLIVIFRSLV